MPRPKKPATQKPTDWNQVKTLLEAQEKTIAIIAEGVADIRPRILGLEKRAEVTSDELRSLADVVRGLKKDVELVTWSTSRTTQEMETVKTELRLIRSDLAAFDNRLSAVEAKTP